MNHDESMIIPYGNLLLRDDEEQGQFVAISKKEELILIEHYLLDHGVRLELLIMCDDVGLELVFDD